MDSIWSMLSTGFDIFMKLAQLALEYLKVLAWPAAVLTLALIYRRPLVNLLHRIREASGWGLSVKAEASDLANDAHITRAIEEATVGSAQVIVSSDEAARPAEQDSDSHPSIPATTTPVETGQTATSPTPEVVAPPTGPSAPGGRAVQEQDPATLHTLTWAQRRNHPWSADVEFFDKHTTPRRAARVKEAWRVLIGLAFLLGRSLDLPPSGRQLSEVVHTLMELGYVSIGSWRIAVRLERLYGVIKSDPNPPTEEVASDFIEAANDLTSILVSVKERLTSSRVRFVNGRPQPSDPNGHEADVSG